VTTERRALVGSSPLLPESFVERPETGRVFSAQRRIRLSDMDARGRLRLDAVARYLQDAAGDDVDELAWGAPLHLWVMRRIRVEVVVPVVEDRHVELTTWCSGLGSVAAGRRLSLVGDRGGRIEADSVWAHLGPDGRPARLDDSFTVYAEAAAGRRVSTRLELADPPDDAPRTPWPLRASDVDVMDHLNNAVHWQAVEHALRLHGFDASRPLVAELDYRDPLDLGDAVELVISGGEPLLAALRVGGVTRAAARVTGRGQLPSSASPQAAWRASL
jgi:acyl-ACP thioesterase